MGSCASTPLHWCGVRNQSGWRQQPTGTRLPVGACSQSEERSEMEERYECGRSSNRVRTWYCLEGSSCRGRHPPQTIAFRSFPMAEEPRPPKRRNGGARRWWCRAWCAPCSARRCWRKWPCTGRRSRWTRRRRKSRPEPGAAHRSHWSVPCRCTWCPTSSR